MSFIEQFQKYDFPNLDWTRLPKPPITSFDKQKYGCESKESNSKFLSRLVMAGFEEKLSKGIIPKDKTDEYIKRCKTELDTFEELHFTDYMLLVWKVIEKAKELGVFIDYGRGSVSGSIVSWLLGISGVDPIRYGLFFSRFLNKARAKSKKINNEVWLDISLILDIDVNLGEGRDKIIEWLKEIYPNRVSKVSNVSTLTGKILVKDVFKTLENANEDDSKKVSDLIERRFGVVQDIEEVHNGVKDDKTGEWKIEPNKEFQEWVSKHKETYDISLKLRNLIRQAASHASGYLISFEDMTEHTPLCLSLDKETKKYHQCSVYTKDYVQCIKLDLETNQIIKNTLNKININLDDVNLEDDPIIYDQFQNGNLLPYGLYQISADCAYKVCNNLKPKNVMELSDVNAIARPGALAWEKSYVQNDAELPHPIFKNALSSTRNLCLYQENMIQMAMDIGFSDVESEMIRRVVGKKKIDASPFFC